MRIPARSLLHLDGKYSTKGLDPVDAFRCHRSRMTPVRKIPALPRGRRQPSSPVGPTCGRPRPTLQLSEDAHSASLPSRTRSLTSGTLPRTSGVQSGMSGSLSGTSGTQSRTPQTGPRTSRIQSRRPQIHSGRPQIRSRRPQIHSGAMAGHPQEPVLKCHNSFTQAHLRQNSTLLPATLT